MKHEDLSYLVEFTIEKGFHRIEDKMETREEYQRGIYEHRRRDFLADYHLSELLSLMPENERAYYQELMEDEDRKDLREEIIDTIIGNVWDKQINPEVR